MATTQEFYKTQGRQPRYATVLATFANGMYITEQQVPEGYAKYLVNYDIDDTGSFIQPRKGRSKVFETSFRSDDAYRENNTKFPQGAHLIGPVWINETVEQDFDTITTVGTTDVIWGLGVPGRYVDFVELSAGHSFKNYDENYYYFMEYDYTRDDNTAERYTPGWDDTKCIERRYTTGFTMVHNDDDDSFETINIVGMGWGRTPARVIKGAWAFDTPFKNKLSKAGGEPEYENILFRPVAVNYNNSWVMFSASYPQLTRTLNQATHYPNLDQCYLKPQLCSYTLSQNRFTYNGTEYKTKFLSPKFFETDIKCATATTMGFNMLAYDPYVFEDTQATRNIPVGIMCYARGTTGAYNVPVMNPILGQTNRFRFYCQYSNSAEFDYDIDYLDLNSYTPDDTDHWVNLTAVGMSRYMGAITFDWVPTTSRFLMRVTMYTGNKGTTTGKASAYPYSRPFTAVTGDDKGAELKKYNLYTAKGIVSWLDCIGVYGVEGAVDGIFFSDVGNPGYFPFPNNVITFDGAIYAVKNYMNNLLVITNSAFWLLQRGNSIANTICTKVLDNLDITEIDATNVVVLKDSIFFKSGNAFYVLKPNKYTSDNTDLKKYVNSTAISYFLNNFHDSVMDLLRKTYKTSIQYIRNINHNDDYDFKDFDLLDNVAYLVNEEVHNVYVIQPYIGTPNGANNDYGRIELHLIYNTLTRAWRIYLTTVGAADEVGHNPIIYQDKKSRDIYEFWTTHGSTRKKYWGKAYEYDYSFPGRITVSKQDRDVQTDDLTLFYDYTTRPDNYSGTFDPNTDAQTGSYELTKFYENYNYIDTGDVALTDISLKRFRELQIAIYSKEHEQIEFYGDFKVDGAETVSATKYDVEVIDDPVKPDYGNIYISANEEANLFKWEDSTLDAVDPTRELWNHGIEKLGGYWQLDLSAFPDLDTINMRIELKGKGRRCSFQLLNTSLQQYQLSNWMWVYRLMNARRIK